MLVRVNGELVHQLFQVKARPMSRALLSSVDGGTYRFRYGWQLTSEEGGRYAGEAAMLAVVPLDIAWVPSGDLQLIEEEAKAPAELPLEAKA